MAKTYKAFELRPGHWAVESTTTGVQANGKRWESTFTHGARHATEADALAWIETQQGKA